MKRLTQCTCCKAVYIACNITILNKICFKDYLSVASVLGSAGLSRKHSGLLLWIAVEVLFNLDNIDLYMAIEENIPCLPDCSASTACTGVRKHVLRNLATLSAICLSFLN
jgi:hypothetical protein